MSHIKLGASIVVPDSLSVDAASAAGVQHFVYISVTGTLPTWGIFLETRRAVEEYVKQSGMIYTILRPNYLMDLWLGPGVDFDIANARVQIFGSGEGKINWVALGDVLQFAIQALDHPAAHNATLELNGPDWLSQMDVIRLCEEIGGRPFAIQHVPEESLQEQANTATDEYGQTFAILMLCVARGFLVLACTEEVLK